ncbi:MAG TPA: phosphoethanolamine--lipid A transferase [Lysobacter sp.]|nr:phosphoethanolamine--lipid A transferase [Lysobacter sp.]
MIASMIRNRPALRANTLLALAALFLLLAANGRLWQVVLPLAPAGIGGVGFALAIGVLLFVLTAILLLPLSFKPLFKPWLLFVLFAAAVAAYFMDHYGVVVDRFAIQSVAETDTREGAEWLSWNMLWTFLALFALPAALACWVRIDWQPFRRELWSRIKLALLLALALVLVAVLSGRQIASTLRNHRELGHLANPLAVLSASMSYAHHLRGTVNVVAAPLGRDARREGGMAAGGKPVVFVLVLGESARAASFSLGGYARDTNPELAKLPIDYFRNVSSCGTDTAVSVPCMFSNLGRSDYKESKAAASENVLDILSHAGYRVTWYDNNTGSKGVAKRLDERDEYDSQDPRFCGKAGCFDELLVDNLRAELGAKADDRIVVLHTKGSHGPAYYQRYPKAFARFQPDCTTNELQLCSREQIVNAYDNTILYTDHIVASAIHALQGDDKVDSALLYMADHGESTGEGGLYLHGAPYLIAPESQTHIPMVLWLSDGYRARRGLDAACIAGKRYAELSQDNLFDTLLGLLGVQTTAYRPALDAFTGCAKATTVPSAH